MYTCIYFCVRHECDSCRYLVLMANLIQGEVGSSGPTGSPGKEGLIGAKVRAYCKGNVLI